jgi:hypothetical protein
VNKKVRDGHNNRKQKLLLSEAIADGEDSRVHLTGFTEDGAGDVLTGPENVAVTEE